MEEKIPHTFKCVHVETLMKRVNVDSYNYQHIVDREDGMVMEDFVPDSDEQFNMIYEENHKDLADTLNKVNSLFTDILKDRLSVEDMKRKIKTLHENVRGWHIIDTTTEPYT